MNFIDNQKIDEIRSEADIVTIISNYVSLTQRGKNYFGICPFHDDNHPSMSVSPEKQIYTCFSCGATGNVFKFIMDYENISFPEAVKKVGDLVGIHIDGIKTTKKNDNKLYDIYDLSVKFYQNNINTKTGKEAVKYLENRNIDLALIKEFQIGLALNNNLLSKLLSKKFDTKEILNSGLVSKSDYDIRDLYIDRIMFPLYNLNGQVVAFSGRVYNKEDSSKYINTRETEIFKKGELIYNYHRAKDFAREKNQIIIMEGFMDVIRAYSVNIKNVVATMGTAVTKNQANIIKKMAKEIIICFDGDLAGEKATLTCADELINFGITPKVIRLEDNLDPDEYILKFGYDKFKEKIDNPINIMDFKLSNIKRKKDLTSSADMAKYVNESIKEIEKIDDDILKEITIQKLSKESNLDVSIIKSKLTKKEKEKISISKKNYSTKYEKAQICLLYYMTKSNEVIKIYNKKMGYMPTTKYRLLAREIYSFSQKYGDINLASLIDYVHYDKEMTDAIGEISKLNLKENFTYEEIDDYIKTINEYNVKFEIDRLTKLMKTETDTSKKLEIANRIIELKKGE